MPRCSRIPSALEASWRRGTTLPEVLVAMALLGLVLVGVGELTVASRRAHARTEEGVEVFRGAALAASWMSRELRLCRDLYAPARPEGGWRYGEPLEPGPEGCLHVVFRRPAPGFGEDRVVAFRFDGPRRVVERALYRPDFHPGRPSTQVLQGPPRTLASGIDGMSFFVLDPALRHGAPFVGLELSMQVQPRRWLSGRVSSPVPMPGSPLRAEVRVRGL